jgi:hypothetical protein
MRGVWLGIRSGVIIAWVYVLIVGLVYIVLTLTFTFWPFTGDFSPDKPSNVDFFTPLLIFYAVGSIIGGVLGTIVGISVGAITGLVIWFIMQRSAFRLQRLAWLAGLTVCAGLWLVIHLTLGQLILDIPDDDLFSSELLYWILMLVPGTLYIVAGAVLAHRYYPVFLTNGSVTSVPSRADA